MKLKQIPKTIIVLVLVFSITSCKKENRGFAKVKAGEEKKYTLAMHDVILDPDYDAGTGLLKHSIDLDKDGINDVEFTSLEYESWYFTGKAIEVSFEVNNADSLQRKISFYEPESSGVQYETVTEVHSFADNGTTPIKTIIRKRTCEEREGAYFYNSNGAVNCLEKGDKVKNIPFTEQSKKFDLVRNDLTKTFDPVSPPGTDTLIGAITEIQGLCEGRAPYNQDFYLIFMITEDIEEDPRYGWIQLYLTGQNTLTIVASGIKKN